MTAKKKISGIYGLVDPGTNEVRYIGQSLDIESRYKQHVRYRKESAKHYPIYCWIDSLLANGLAPRLIVIEHAPVDIDKAEIYWIAYYKDKSCNILNIAKGGSHIPMSAIQRVSNGISGSASRLKNHEENPAAKRIWQIKKQMSSTLRMFHSRGMYFHEYKLRLKMKCLAAYTPKLCGDWSVL